METIWSNVRLFRSVNYLCVREYVDQNSLQSDDRMWFDILLNHYDRSLTYSLISNTRQQQQNKNTEGDEVARQKIPSKKSIETRANLTLAWMK